MKDYQRSIGKDNAIALAKTGWWKTCTPDEICSVQLFTVELCMDFGDFHGAMEKCLGRPIWTHEFGPGYDGLVKEFLGEKQAPSMEEIINLIPEDKRIVLVS